MIFSPQKNSGIIPWTVGTSLSSLPWLKKKAFDCINRETLWMILEKTCYSFIFDNMIKQKHSERKARVTFHQASSRKLCLAGRYFGPDTFFSLLYYSIVSCLSQLWRKNPFTGFVTNSETGMPNLIDRFSKSCSNLFLKYQACSVHRRKTRNTVKR